MNSPYRWQGGKYYEKEVIIPLMPVHNYYAETFFGSGVLLLNKPKPQSKKEFANDKFDCLISFWRCIHRSRLARRLMKLCEHTLDSRYIYQEYMRMKPEELNIVDRAYRFMYLDFLGFNSYFDTYYTPVSHVLPTLRDHIGAFRNTGQRLMKCWDRVKDVHFDNLDFRDFLDKLKPRDDLFILLDPPYINTHGYNRGYGVNLDFPEEWYLEMRAKLEYHSDNGSMFMITCNQENTYFDSMKGVILKNIERRACINKNTAREPVRTKLVMNYDVNEVGSCLLMNEQEDFGDVMVL